MQILILLSTHSTAQDINKLKVKFTILPCVTYLQGNLLRNVSSGDFIKLGTSQMLLPGYKHIQHVTVLNTVGTCNTMVFMCINIYKHRKDSEIAV